MAYRIGALSITDASMFTPGPSRPDVVSHSIKAFNWWNVDAKSQNDICLCTRCRGIHIRTAEGSVVHCPFQCFPPEFARTEISVARFKDNNSCKCIFNATSKVCIVLWLHNFQLKNMLLMTSYFFCSIVATFITNRQKHINGANEGRNFDFNKWRYPLLSMEKNVILI